MSWFYRYLITASTSSNCDDETNIPNSNAINDLQVHIFDCIILETVKNLRRNSAEFINSENRINYKSQQIINSVYK